MSRTKPFSAKPFSAKWGVFVALITCLIFGWLSGTVVFFNEIGRHPKIAKDLKPKQPTEAEIFQAQSRVRIENELRPFKLGVSRRGTWNTATYLRKAAASLVVHITSDREIWIPPQPGNTELPDEISKFAYPRYAFGSLAALQLLLRHAAVIPDVTVVLFFAANCMYSLSDSALMFHYHDFTRNISMTPEWKAWLKEENEDDFAVMDPLNVTFAPALHYQSATWTPSSLECRGVTFPQYDWFWEKQDFTDGSPDRKDGLAKLPWEDRKPMLVFRGEIKQDSIPFRNNAGLGSIRGRAAQLGLSRPDILDIKLTDSFCKAPKPSNCRNPQLSVDLYDTTPSRFLTYEEQLQYKYQLDLDGHGGTFRLKHLFLSGSLVFKVDSPINQFWMLQLTPWVHYVPVRWHDLETDLVLKVEWARNNDAKAKQIMWAGRQFVLKHLDDVSMAWYQEQVLRQLSDLQIPPFPKLPGSIRFCCQLIPNHMEWYHYKQKCFQYQTSCKTRADQDIFQTFFPNNVLKDK